MRSVGPAAGLGGPMLAWTAVAVGVAGLTLVQSAIQNVLNVLHYQVDGHCKKQRGGYKELAKSLGLSQQLPTMQHPPAFCKNLRLPSFVYIPSKS